LLQGHHEPVGAALEAADVVDEDVPDARGQGLDGERRQPVIATHSRSLSGSVPPQLLRGEPSRLDRQALIASYGSNFVRSVPERLCAGKGKGVSADERAVPLGGFTSSRQPAALAEGPREEPSARRTHSRRELCRSLHCRKEALP
jgi:hypothetical protein